MHPSGKTDFWIAVLVPIAIIYIFWMLHVLRAVTLALWTMYKLRKNRKMLKPPMTTAIR